MVARKNPQIHSFDFPKIPAAKKNGSYKSVTATRVVFSPREQHPPTPIAHTHGHAKDLGPNQAVWAAIIFAALMQQNWSVSSTKQAAYKQRSGGVRLKLGWPTWGSYGLNKQAVVTPANC